MNLGVLVNCSTSISSKYGTLTDIVDAARKSPRKLNFGAINPGSTQNLSAHLFKQLTGIDVTIVPFRTTPDLVTALLRNDVDVGFDYYAGLQSVINDKKVRVTAVSGEKRIPLLANVPTAEESGFPDFVVVGWNALTAPAGLPVDVLRILNREVNSALADPEVRQKTEGLGMIARGSTPQEMHARMGGYAGIEQDCDLKRRGSYQSTCGRRISFFGAAVALAPSN